MNENEFYIYILAIIFGIFQIGLFFKLWRMADDVREIKQKYLEEQQQKTQTLDQPLSNPQISNEANTKDRTWLWGGLLVAFIITIFLLVLIMENN